MATYQQAECKHSLLSYYYAGIKQLAMSNRQ
jgi:hypothetical protein